MPASPRADGGAGDGDDGQRQRSAPARTLRRRSGAVDSRTISFVESSMRSASTRWPSIRRVSRLTPVRPIFCERLANGRQARRDDHGVLGVVEADDRQVLGHPQVALARCVQRADRDVVVEAEDRGGRIGELEQLRARRSYRARSHRSGRRARDRARCRWRRARRVSRAGAPRSRTSPCCRRSRRCGDGRARADARSPVCAGCVHRGHAGMPSGGGSRGSTTTNGYPCCCRHAVRRTIPRAASGSRRRWCRASGARAATPRDRARAAWGRARCACRSCKAPLPRRSASARSRRRRRAATSARSCPVRPLESPRARGSC